MIGSNITPNNNTILRFIPSFGFLEASLPYIEVSKQMK